MQKQRPELLELYDIDIPFSEDIEDALDHGYIVSELAYRLAKEYGCDDEFCELIKDAGMIHDIGKLEIADYLYGRRENALKIEEIKYVRMHPTLGYKMLNEHNIGTDELRRIVLHHHENYDGSGYPENIKAEAIPFGSRILRVCDVYSALISNRPYRPAFDRNTAMELMIDEVKNYDMKIFLAFMRVVHRDDFSEIVDFVNLVNRKHKAGDK